MLPLSGIQGQSPRREPAAAQLPPSARAAGLGHAYQLGAPDPDVVFYNPALVGRGSGFRMGYQRFAETAGSLSLSAGTTAFGGALGVGLQAMEYGSFGPGERGGGIDPITRGGGTGTSETIASLAYARALGPIRVGVTGKMLAQRFGGLRETRASWDVGIATDVSRLWIGATARNLGPNYHMDGVEVSQAEELSLGLGGYGYQGGELDLGVAGSVTGRGDGEWLGGGGVEVGYYPVTGRTFVARIGARNVPEGDASPLTLGGSYWGDSLVLEYAFQPVERADGIHRFTFGWR